MERDLNTGFVQDLKNGILKPILEMVLDERSLILEIRGNYVNIYYRGGKALQIDPYKTTRYGRYKFTWDVRYAADLSPKTQMQLGSKLKRMKGVRNAKDSKKWSQQIPELTRIMDGWLSKREKKEKYVQQEIVESGLLTDYLLTDFEYQKKNKARFDLMGIKMGRKKSILSFIELKYGSKSLRTQGSASGFKKHLEDIVGVIKGKKEIKEEIAQARRLFEIKKDLKLPSRSRFPSNISQTEIEVLFILSDYRGKGKNYSKQLENEINDIQIYMKSVRIKISLIIMFLKSNISGNKTRILKPTKRIPYLDHSKGRLFYS